MLADDYCHMSWLVAAAFGGESLQVCHDTHSVVADLQDCQGAQKFPKADACRTLQRTILSWVLSWQHLSWIEPFPQSYYCMVYGETCQLL